MSGLELPPGASAPDKEEPELPGGPSDVVVGVICPIKSSSTYLPGQDILGRAGFQPTTAHSLCVRSCAWYLPNKRHDKPGQCAVTAIAKAARSKGL